MTDWEAREVQANGVRLRYYRTGGKKPRLVLAHGLSDNASCWRRVVDALAPSYDVVFYDARGHGQSEAPADGYGPADRAADLAGLIAKLGLAPVGLVGHSLGAETVAWAAAHDPQLVDRLVLEDPPWRNDWTGAGPQDRASMAEGWRAALTENKSHTRDELVAFCHSRSPDWAEADLVSWAESKLAVALSAVSSVSAPRPPWQDIARRFACPVLLVTGEPQRGALVTPEVATEAAALCPSLEVVHVPGAGHSVRRDRFAGYIQAVSTFLGRSVD